MRNHSLTLTASHIMRFYIWDLLQEYMGDVWKPLELSNNRQSIPIIPVQEQPEVQTSENPYFVYIYDTNATTDLYVLQSEVLSMRMYSQSPATIAATGKLCTIKLNKWDETAQEINLWMRNGGLDAHLPPDWMDEANRFIFKTVMVSGIQGAQPADDQGGRVDSLITIEMTYVEAGEPSLISNNPT